VLHSNGVALRRRGKRENGQSWRQRSEARESPQTVEEEPERTERHSAAGGGQEGAQSPWWQRMFGS